MPISKISRFTSKAVQLAKNAVGSRGEVAAPERGGGFVDYAVVSLRCLQVYLEESHRETLDLLSEMPHILEQIALEPVDLPHHSTLLKWFDRIKTALWRVLLGLSAQLHDLSRHAAIDTMFFDGENASKHYCRRTYYRVQTLKATALVDTESQAILDVHCTTEKRHDTQLDWRLAVDKGYDWMELREKLRQDGMRPLIKHREFQSIDPRVVCAIDGPRYDQRAMCGTVFSTIKRTLGGAVHA